MDADKVYDMLEKVQEDVTEIKIIMARNTASLEEHVRRTNILESKVSHVEEHVVFVQRLSKLIPWTLGVVVSLLAVLTALKLI